jgi:hypothetical protein
MVAGGARHPGATIALMAKFKPAKGKRKKPALPQGGLPCVIVVITAMALLLLFIFLVMKYANG